MEIQVGLAKVGKYAVGQSGDSVEVVERPRGGLSVVIVDGQGHGSSAKRISHQVAMKAANLIGDGARDGAVMRAVNDFLYALRDGRVSATVTVLTADLEAKSLIVSRNSNSPVIIGHQDGTSCLDSDVHPIGTRKDNRPSISHWPMYPGSLLIGFTDGVTHAGRIRGQYRFSLDYVQELLHKKSFKSQQLADHLLDYAIAAEDGKPRDDMVVAVMALHDMDRGLGKRRLSLSYPY